MSRSFPRPVQFVVPVSIIAKPTLAFNRVFSQSKASLPARHTGQARSHMHRTSKAAGTHQLLTSQYIGCVLNGILFLFSTVHTAAVLKQYILLHVVCILLGHTTSSSNCTLNVELHSRSHCPQHDIKVKRKSIKYIIYKYKTLQT